MRREKSAIQQRSARVCITTHFARIFLLFPLSQSTVVSTVAPLDQTLPLEVRLKINVIVRSSEAKSRKNVPTTGRFQRAPLTRREGGALGSA